MAILFDTSFLVAHALEKDINHTRAKQFISTLSRSVPRLMILPAFLELFQVISIRTNYQTAVNVFAKTSTAYRIVTLDNDDFARMQSIMRRYADNRFDFVDVAIMAMAERLQITQIATFDRRDFSVYRPLPDGYFTLLP